MIIRTHQTYNGFRKKILIIFLSSFSLILGNLIPTTEYSIEGSGWMTESAQADITTEGSLWMAGYEGKTSQYHKGFPSVWESSVELDILSAVTQLARENNIPLVRRSLAK